MNVLDIDYLLGRHISINGQLWRVLEIRPDSDCIRTLCAETPLLRGDWRWSEVRELVRTGELPVE